MSASDVSWGRRGGVEPGEVSSTQGRASTEVDCLPSSGWSRRREKSSRQTGLKGQVEHTLVFAERTEAACSHQPTSFASARLKHYYSEPRSEGRLTIITNQTQSLTGAHMLAHGHPSRTLACCCSPASPARGGPDAPRRSLSRSPTCPGMLDSILSPVGRSVSVCV